MTFKKLSLFASALMLLSACAPHSNIYDNAMVEEAKVNTTTRADDILKNLPAPKRKVAVVAYDFQDQTGQFKNNGNYTDYSSAVTKGGYSILIKALLDTSHGQWFTVSERGNLKDLLQERQLIKLTRAQYAGPRGGKLGELPPLVYGGMLLEGGIIAYDSNVLTGGAGAAFLGISGSVQYRRDLVTVYLRAVSVQTGEVLLSVTSSKTVYSSSLDANYIKYVTIDHLLQTEAGVTLNEPTQLAVRQAVETAVYSLIMEGAIDNIWSFKRHAEGDEAINNYIARRDGVDKVTAKK
ncbi:MAG TPA: CsgG/HfaB family protein [Rickettsiales bacterium]|nr:CsgG/HfaB family protein [Rickettsiales bacterium]